MVVYARECVMRPRRHATIPCLPVVPLALDDVERELAVRSYPGTRPVNEPPPLGHRMVRRLARERMHHAVPVGAHVHLHPEVPLLAFPHFSTAEGRRGAQRTDICR